MGYDDLKNINKAANVFTTTISAQNDSLMCITDKKCFVFLLHALAVT